VNGALLLRSLSKIKPNQPPNFHALAALEFGVVVVNGGLARNEMRPARRPRFSFLNRVFSGIVPEIWESDERRGNAPCNFYFSMT